MKIMISCGGTGGHIYPGIAVANEIKYRHPDCDVLFVGSLNPYAIENKIVPDNGYELTGIRVEPFESFFSKWRKFKNAMGLFGSVNQSLKIISRFKPDIVIGTGGFVCGPVVLAGKLKGLPTLIAEQNVIPGKTNKILSSFADKVCVSFEDSIKNMSKPEKCVYTGNPLRREFNFYNRKNARALLNLSDDDKMLLVFGGSLGALSLNNAIVKAIKDITDDKSVKVYFVTGSDNYENVTAQLAEVGVDLSKKSNINVFSYTNEMPKLMNAADLVVCRSGASTISEVNHIGIAAIYVPLKHAANDHQRKNAMANVKQNAAYIVEDDEQLDVNLTEKIKYLLGNDSQRKIMADNSAKMGNNNAAEMICDLIEELIG